MDAEDRRCRKQSVYEGVPISVKNLDINVSEELLKAQFSPFGYITKILLSNENPHMQSAIIYFSSPVEAGNAIARMNETELLSNTIYISSANSRKRRERKVSMQRRSGFTWG